MIHLHHKIPQGFGQIRGGFDAPAERFVQQFGAFARRHRGEGVNDRVGERVALKIVRSQQINQIPVLFPVFDDPRATCGEAFNFWRRCDHCLYQRRIAARILSVRRRKLRSASREIAVTFDAAISKKGPVPAGSFNQPRIEVQYNCLFPVGRTAMQDASERVRHKALAKKT